MSQHVENFAITAFESSLNTGAILFGVFGFLYSVYAMYSNPTDAKNLARPPIVRILRNLCRGIAVLSLSNLFVTVAAMLSLTLSQNEYFLAVALIVIVGSTAAISTWMAFDIMS